MTIAPGGGIEAGSGPGSIAALVTRDGSTQPLALSAGHVLLGTGARTFCPDRGGREVGEVVAECSDPRLDGGLSSLAGQAPDPQVVGLGIALTSTARPAIGSRVVKSGRATQRTRGIVTAVNRTLLVDLANVGAVRVRGFIIEPDPSQPGASGPLSAEGDSGAPWILVDQFGQTQPVLVGVHVAGGTRGQPAKPYAFACHADEIMADLGARLWLPDAALATRMPTLARPAIPMLVGTREAAILRGLPSETARRIDGLAPGQLVHVLSVKDGWAKLSLHDDGLIDGYVWEGLLVPPA